jgi:hypothetical protein
VFALTQEVRQHKHRKGWSKVRHGLVFALTQEVRQHKHRRAYENLTMEDSIASTEFKKIVAHDKRLNNYLIVFPTTEPY